ncbi:hypothetical protein WN51_12914 [Melipona quadrifasciata]|uniref:Uncharacterized protein n=1 Tax=Melipona quadrifasciata TaxID=166423 RepID=A0A0N0BKD1_9HYME|nr:hypothetical protein WN51_12914 [Melipona quadrifasciata]
MKFRFFYIKGHVISPDQLRNACERLKCIQVKTNQFSSQECFKANDRTATIKQRKSCNPGIICGLYWLDVTSVEIEQYENYGKSGENDQLNYIKNTTLYLKYIEINTWIGKNSIFTESRESVHSATLIRDIKANKSSGNVLSTIANKFGDNSESLEQSLRNEKVKPNCNDAENISRLTRMKSTNFCREQKARNKYTKRHNRKYATTQQKY